MKKIANSSKKYYEEKLSTYGPNIKGLNWKNIYTQKLRFQILSKIANLNNSSIHDFGCGFGDLNKFLNKKFNKISYFGTDISKMMIEEAIKKNRKNSKFYNYDIINQKFNKKFVCDYVLNSGVFTVKDRISSEKWWNYVKIGIFSMFKYSRKGIAFNLMTSNVDYKDNHLFYKSSIEVSDFIKKNISQKIKIFYSHKLWEYTIFIYK